MGWLVLSNHKPGGDLAEAVELRLQLLVLPLEGLQRRLRLLQLRALLAAHLCKYNIVIVYGLLFCYFVFFQRRHERVCGFAHTASCSFIIAHYSIRYIYIYIYILTTSRASLRFGAHRFELLLFDPRLRLHARLNGRRMRLRRRRALRRRRRLLLKLLQHLQP